MTSPAGDDEISEGFQARASLAGAWAWLDQFVGARGRATTEIVTLADAVGRALAEPVAAPADMPDADRAAANGYAVRAADCDGASAYNPLRIAAIARIASGDELPSGADAILSADQARRIGSALDVCAPIAFGAAIVRRGSAARAGELLIEKGRRLGPRDIGILAALGAGEVSVFRAPLVRIAIPGAKFGPDALTSLLRALLDRDGARVAADSSPDLATALDAAGDETPDIVLVGGRVGDGPDDIAPRALRAAGGKIDLRGVALHPGGAASFGTLADGAPVVMLPGEPFACLVAYDMLASRLVRRLAGLPAALPYRGETFTLERKIASALGVVEVVSVRLNGTKATPVGVDAGLIGAAGADGFVVVAAAGEGFPRGAEVRVNIWNCPVAGRETTETW